MREFDNEDYLNKQFEKYNLDKNKLAFFTVQDGRVLIETSAKNLQTRACKALKQVLEYLFFEIFFELI